MFKNILVILFVLSFAPASVLISAELGWAGKVIGPNLTESSEKYASKVYEFLASDNTIILMQFKYKNGNQIGGRPKRITLKHPELEINNFEGPEPENFHILKTIPGEPHNMVISLNYEVGIDYRTSDNSLYYDRIVHGIVPDNDNAQEGEIVLSTFKSIDDLEFNSYFFLVMTGNPISGREDPPSTSKEVTVSMPVERVDRIEEARNPSGEVTVKPLKINWPTSGTNIYDIIQAEEEKALLPSKSKLVDETEDARNPLMETETEEIDLTTFKLNWKSGNVFDEEDEVSAPLGK